MLLAEDAPTALEQLLKQDPSVFQLSHQLERFSQGVHADQGRRMLVSEVFARLLDAPPLDCERLGEVEVLAHDLGSPCGGGSL